MKILKLYFSFFVLTIAAIAFAGPPIVWGPSSTAKLLPNGGLQMPGATSGTFTQKANTSTTAYTIIWPAAQSSGTNFLQNDGAGNLTWASSSVSTATPTVTGVVTSFVPIIKSSTVNETDAGYSFTTTDGFGMVVITIDNAVNETVTLPLVAANIGRTITAKLVLNGGSGKMVVSQNGGDSGSIIDNAYSSTNIQASGGYITVQSDGTNWQVITANDFARQYDSAGVTPTSNSWKTVANITVGAGEWDFNGVVDIQTATGSGTGGTMGALSAFTDNTTTDHSTADNVVIVNANPSTNADSMVTIPQWHQALTSTSTYYVKCKLTFSSWTGDCVGRISGRRTR